MNPTPHQQLSLFDSPAHRIAALGRATKCALRAAVAASGLTRPEVVFRANELAAESGVSMCAGNGALSEATFNKWLDLNSPGHMPGFVPLTILCSILEDTEIFAAALAVQGFEVMGPEDCKFRDLGRATYKLKQARLEYKKAEESL
ncbi:hypothetical protein C4J81_15510 [Deltaproteobacteria bacterium Smac51]|nr:hypothetical protein C4J81_15510 [Deltaproteobacteria bacterium Smac51]